MKIGILEIMPQGHYTLVDSVARIFGSSTNNEIFIFVNSDDENQINHLLKLNMYLQIISKNKNESLPEFFSKIIKAKLDVLYIITLEKYFNEVLKINFNCQVNLFIHNIDEWFQNYFLDSISFLVQNFSFEKKFFYHLKTKLLYPHLKRQLIKKLQKINHSFVVLNKNLKIELSKFVNENYIEVIPFSVYDSNLKDNSIQNKLIRVCIPGMISQFRRDYFSLLKLLESDIEFYRKNFEFDLLGGISVHDLGNEIIEASDKLIKLGMNIIYYNNQLVPVNEFDIQLSKADIILGNMNVVLSKQSSYGKTKDSGIIFTMIRAAKPGILPKEYLLIDELKSSTLIFDNYKHLDEILRELYFNKNKLLNLKQEAKKNSHQFEPKNIYESIMR